MEVQQISKEVNEAYKKMCLDYGLIYTGFQFINRKNLEGGIRFHSTRFLKVIEEAGVSLDEGIVPVEFQSIDGLAFRAQLNQDPIQKDKYFAIKWNSIGAKNLDDYEADYATNDKNYVEFHRALGDIIWTYSSPLIKITK